MFARYIGQDFKVPHLQRDGMLGNDVSRFTQLRGRQLLAFDGNDLARFSRSASACFAIARCNVSGSWMFFISAVLI